MKRTLLFENQELLDFEVDFSTSEIRVLDAPDADDSLLCSLGFGGPDRDAFVADSIRVRRMSERREDAKQILGAFGVRSALELAFRGRGLSLADKLWYRAPGATERWEDINFFDNDWDASFCEAVLTHCRAAPEPETRLCCSGSTSWGQRASPEVRYSLPETGRS